MSLRTSLLVLVGLLVLAGSARADTWASPRPKDFTSPSRNRTFKVTPGKRGLFDNATGVLILRDKDGKEKTAWERKLVNLPHQAFVSDHTNHVVTIDTYARLGGQHSLVVYGKDGKVLADYQLEDLLTREDIRRHVTQTVSSRWWASGAKCAFSAEGNEFVATLSWGKVIKIDLANPPPRKAAPVDARLAGPALGTILSGEALNDQLRELQAVRKGPEVALADNVLKHINLMTEGSKGSLALLRNKGKVAWPSTLKQDDFQTARKRIDTLLARTLQQVQKGKPAAVKELAEAMRQIEATLAKEVDELSPAQYIEASRFLRQLDEAVKAIEGPNAKANLKLVEEIRTKGKTVAALVAFMKERKLRFVAAVAGDEDAYRSLQRAFAEYLAVARRPKKE
jgi:hypothetical protein